MTPLQLDIFVCSLACMSLFGLPTAIWGNLGLTSCRWLALSLCSCNTPLVGARVWYCLGFDKVVVGFFHNMCFIWRRLTLAARTQVLVTSNLMKFILYTYNDFVAHFACFLFSVQVIGRRITMAARF